MCRSLPFVTTAVCLFVLRFIFFLTSKARDGRDVDLNPGLGRSTGERNGYPILYFCLENSMDRGAWWAPVQGVIKSQTWTQTYKEVGNYSLSEKHWLAGWNHCLGKMKQVRGQVGRSEAAVRKRSSLCLNTWRQQASLKCQESKLQFSNFSWQWQLLFPWRRRVSDNVIHN